MGIQVRPGILFNYLIYCFQFIAFVNVCSGQNVVLSNENISVEIRFQNYSDDSLDVISFLENLSIDTIWLAVNNSDYIKKLDGGIEVYFGWDQKNPHDLFKMAQLLPNEKIIISDRIEKAKILSVYVLCSYVVNSKYINNGEILGDWHLKCGKWDEFTINKLIMPY